MTLCELVEQASGVGVMYVIIPATMGESEVDVGEGGDVVDGGLDVALRIGGWGGHVSLGVDRVVVQPIGHCAC